MTQILQDTSEAALCPCPTPPLCVHWRSERRARSLSVSAVVLGRIGAPDRQGLGAESADCRTEAWLWQARVGRVGWLALH